MACALGTLLRSSHFKLIKMFQHIFFCQFTIFSLLRLGWDLCVSIYGVKQKSNPIFFNIIAILSKLIYSIQHFPSVRVSVTAMINFFPYLPRSIWGSLLCFIGIFICFMYYTLFLALLCLRVQPKKASHFPVHLKNEQLFIPFIFLIQVFWNEFIWNFGWNSITLYINLGRVACLLY